MEEEIKLIGYETVVIAQPGHLLGNRPNDKFRFEIPLMEFGAKLFEPLMVGPLKNLRFISAFKVGKAMFVADWAVDSDDARKLWVETSGVFPPTLATDRYSIICSASGPSISMIGKCDKLIIPTESLIARCSAFATSYGT